MKVKRLGLIGLAILFGSTSVSAKVGISAASGYGAAHIVPVRLGIQKEFDKHWNTDSNWPVGGYWEGSFYHMRGKRGDKIGSHNRLNASAVAGVFRFQRSEALRVGGHPYLELGVGLSFLDRKEIGGRDLGMHFQFEDRFGIGFRFGQHGQYDLGYKVIHFSNAYIGPCNHGINLHMLAVGFWFK